MLQKLHKLNLIIGIFFLLLSAILLVDYFTDNAQAKSLNLYTGLAFLLFGSFMCSINRKKKE